MQCLQEIREYDFDVDAARKAAAAAALAAQQAEELRMAFMERDLLGDGVYDSGDAAMGEHCDPCFKSGRNCSHPPPPCSQLMGRQMMLNCGIPAVLGKAALSRPALPSLQDQLSLSRALLVDALPLL